MKVVINEKAILITCNALQQYNTHVGMAMYSGGLKTVTSDFKQLNLYEMQDMENKVLQAIKHLPTSIKSLL